MEAQRDATGKCLTNLLASVGLPAVEPARSASGARAWPQGYTGSVSHKGTTVAAAIAGTDRMRSIGIDVERMDAKPVPNLRGLGAGEQPWASMPEAGGRVVLFSVKEAAFKALHPILGRQFGLENVVVSWTSISPVRCHGIARACDATVDVRCSRAVPSWIASASL